MSNPTKRPGSDNWQFRKRVDRDVVEKARGQTFLIVFPASGNHPEQESKGKFGTFLACSLKTTDKRLAEWRYALTLGEFYVCCDRIRNGTTTQVNSEIIALAKTLFDYYDYENKHFDNSVKFDWLSVEGVEKERESCLDPLFQGYLKSLDVDHCDDESYVSKPIHSQTYPANDHSLAALESRYGAICNWALAKNSKRIKNSDRYTMLVEFERLLDKARIEQARRKALNKNTTFDNNGASIPVTFQSIFDKWKVQEPVPAPNSQRSWQSVIRNIIKFLGHDDANKVSADDIKRWKHALQHDQGLSSTTLQSMYFPGIRRMYSFAIVEEMLNFDPTVGVRISTKRSGVEKIKPYTDVEIETLLEAAKAQDKPYLKWILTLAVVTGARAGELSQLWPEQIKQELKTGIWYIDIRSSPDGGYIKNEESVRHVPIHRAVLNDLLAFRETRKGLPLFYNKPHVNKSKRHPAQSLIVRQSQWINSIDIDFTNKSPNHSVRHWFKSAAIRAGITMDIANVIQGHKREGVSTRYLHYSNRQLLEAIESIPIPTLTVPADMEHARGSTP